MFYNNPYVTYNLTDINTWAHGVGPKSDWLFHYGNETFNNATTSRFVDEAHSLGLAVHPYSLQDDMLKWTNGVIDEHILYLTKQVDGIFTEFPHMTKNAYTKYHGKNTFPPEAIKKAQCAESVE